MSTYLPVNNDHTKIKSKPDSQDYSLKNFNLNNSQYNSCNDVITNTSKSKSSNNDYNNTDGNSWKRCLASEGYNNLIYQKRENDRSWNAETQLLPNLINSDKNDDEKKKENKKWNSSNVNNSTLSLHIAAYENVIKNENLHGNKRKREIMKILVDTLLGVENSQNSTKMLSTKQKNIRKSWKNVKQKYFSNNLTERGIEIPRGKESEPLTPEVMQFKASQKLLDPNSTTPMPKNLDKKLDVPSPVKSPKRRSSVRLADLSKCPKINVDDYIKNLMTSIDADGNVKDYLTDIGVIEQICVLAIENLSRMPSLLELNPEIKVVGDIHGQFIDLLRIFELCGPPDRTKYLFLGDYVDRGPHSLEVICLLLLLRVRYPNNIYMLRGNHECSIINRAYGFLHECEDRFQKIPVDETIWGVSVVDLKGTQVWYRFNDVFNWLPMTALIGGRILCMHGGLSPELVSLDQLRNLARPVDPEAPGIYTDLLWADPDPCLPNGINDPDWGVSARGISSHFNVKAVNHACTRLGLDMIVRGHQVVQDGYEFFANRKLVTIFSAPNYCGEYNNSGAIMTIDFNLQTSFHILRPLASAKKKSKATEVDFDDIDMDALIAQGSAEKS